MQVEFKKMFPLCNLEIWHVDSLVASGVISHTASIWDQMATNDFWTPVHESVYKKWEAVIQTDIFKAQKCFPPNKVAHGTVVY